MRKLLAASFFILYAMTCRSQEALKSSDRTCIGVDVGAAVQRNTMRVTIGRSFGDHWSIEGEHGMRFDRRTSAERDEEQAHYDRFSEYRSETDAKTKDKITAGIKMKYWIRDIYKGAFIMGGARYGNINGTDGLVGAGYSFFIWKGLTCSLAYETGLKGFDENGMRISLNYIF